MTIDLEDRMQKERPVFAVVHPLDDVLEEKVETEHLGPMQMTRTVRACLFALRGYLFLMFGLLAFRVLQLAGVIYG
ncbi:MAG: hypothetical protein ABJC09_03205 [Terriglobia bacterium]